MFEHIFGQLSGPFLGRFGTKLRLRWAKMTSILRSRALESLKPLEFKNLNRSSFNVFGTWGFTKSVKKVVNIVQHGTSRAPYTSKNGPGFELILITLLINFWAILANLYLKTNTELAKRWTQNRTPQEITKIWDGNESAVWCVSTSTSKSCLRNKRKGLLVHMGFSGRLIGSYRFSDFQGPYRPYNALKGLIRRLRAL